MCLGDSKIDPIVADLPLMLELGLTVLARLCGLEILCVSSGSGDCGSGDLERVKILANLRRALF
jgi:hypothetical protein